MHKIRLRKALGVVKDQTSISLAKVTNNASSLDVAVLKATSHDECPTDDHTINQVLSLVSSSKSFAAGCVLSISKRLSKTRNWVVALKSLMLVHNIFQDGDPYFPREVYHTMKQGSRILNLSGFSDDSYSTPWDYTAFVRSFAMYLDERLDCFMKGKLQNRFSFKEENENKELVRDMEPTMLVENIVCWQRLVDRIITNRPTGEARTNSLVQDSIYPIIQESFHLYKDINDGVALLLENYFHLSYQSSINALQTCVKASKQFEDLDDFYELCKSIGVGKTSDYPSVQKISNEVIETLQKKLRDQTSDFSQHFRYSSAELSLSNYPSSCSSSVRDDADYDQYSYRHSSSFPCTESSDEFQDNEDTTKHDLSNTSTIDKNHSLNHDFNLSCKTQLN